MIPIFPTQCSCGSAFYYMKVPAAPSGYVFTCQNDKCHMHGRNYEVPHIGVHEYVEAALLKPKLRVV